MEPATKPMKAANMIEPGRGDEPAGLRQAERRRRARCRGVASHSSRIRETRKTS